MKRLFLLLFTIHCSLFVSFAQQKTEIRQFNLSGPYAVAAPFAVDTVDVQGKKFDDKSLMKAIALTSPIITGVNGLCAPQPV